MVPPNAISRAPQERAPESTLEIIFANTAEAFAKILRTVKSRRERIRRINHEHELSDRALLWSGDNKVVILPRLPNDALLEHVKQVMGFKNVTVLAPTRCGISLCNAVAEDERLLSVLTLLAARHSQTKISAYAITNEFCGLIATLRKTGVQFESYNADTRHSWWITQYLDSKVGFRCELTRICCKIPHLEIPRGYVCTDINDALGASEWFLTRGASCVVKADYGESGWGLCIAGSDPALPIRKSLDSVADELRAGSIWASGPLIVEEWITAENNPACASPSAEVQVDDTGAKVTYVCAQLVNSAGEFKGVILGPEFPSLSHRKTIDRVAQGIGDHFYDLGVRGHFDIDFVISKDGKVYAIETNVRRTGGTHVYDVKVQLGRPFTHHYFLSEDNYVYGETAFPPGEIITRLEQLIFSRKRKEGVIITLLPDRVPQIGYMIIAARYDRVICLQRAFQNALL
jgi:hypothetical protein